MTRIERSVELNAAVYQVRATMGDLAGAAACLPGLTIGERLDARTLKATMGVQVGLLFVRYNGTLSLGAAGARADAVQFRVDGVAPGGLSLSVGIEIVALPRGDAESRLTIVTYIALDPVTTLVSGPMIAIVGGTLLDGFSRNFKKLLEIDRASPASGAVRIPT